MKIEMNALSGSSSAVQILRSPGLNHKANPVLTPSSALRVPTATRLQTAGYPSPALAKIYFGGINIAEGIGKHYDAKVDTHLGAGLTIQELVDKVEHEPRNVANPHQRIWTRVMDGKTSEVSDNLGGTITSYNFVTEPFGDDEDGLQGMEEPVNEIMDTLYQAAKGTEKAKSMILLVGGPGSGKSTIINKLMASYQEELVPQLKWINLPDHIAKAAHAGEQQYKNEYEEPILFNPLMLLPKPLRKQIQEVVNTNLKKQDPNSPFPYKFTRGGLPPATVQIIDELKLFYKDKMPSATPAEIYNKVLAEHARVSFVTPDPVKRKAIGILEAEPPKYANPAHVVGEPHLAKSAALGASNPLAFDYLLGAANASSGGMLHLREGLKREAEDLLKLLMINEEGKAKAAEIGDISLQNMVWMDANFPEYFQKRGDDNLNAFFERTKIIYFTYPTDYKKETQICQKYFDPIAKWDNVKVAPHTYEIGSLWSVMTRLKIPGVAINESPDDIQKYSFLLGKAKLYSGEPINGLTLEQAREMKKTDKEQFEGLVGVSPRILKRNILPDMLTNKQVRQSKAMDGFLLLDSIENWLKYGNREVKISDDVEKPKYLYLVALARHELTQRVAADVEKILLPDQEFHSEVGTYLANAKAYGKAQKSLERATMAVGLGTAVPLGGFKKTMDDAAALMKPLEEEGELTSPEEAHHFRMALYEHMVAAERAGTPFQLDSENKLRKGLLAIKRQAVLRAYPLIPVNPISLDDVQDGARTVLAPVVEGLKQAGYPEASALRALRAYGQLGSR
jgi:serine protein kinase